jgi:hypothetical protein
VGHDGGATVLQPGLDAAELAALQHSADVLQQARATLSGPPIDSRSPR